MEEPPAILRKPGKKGLSSAERPSHFSQGSSQCLLTRKLEENGRERERVCSNREQSSARVERKRERKRTRERKGRSRGRAESIRPTLSRPSTPQPRGKERLRAAHSPSCFKRISGLFPPHFSFFSFPSVHAGRKTERSLRRRAAKGGAKPPES